MSDRRRGTDVRPDVRRQRWCRPSRTIAAGAKTVLPGPNPSAEDLAKLIEEEDVTVSAAVPNVSMGLEYAVHRRARLLGSVFTSGGSATPRSLMEDYKQEFDVDLISGYGMTGTSPVTHAYEPKPGMTDLPERSCSTCGATRGASDCRAGVQVVNTDGEEVPWDGESLGELWMRSS